MAAPRLQLALRHAFHAALSGGFLVAYLSSDEDTYGMHQFAGYTVLTLLVLRLLAAWMASRGALSLPRPQPSAVLPWLRGVARMERGALLGRNPLHALLAALVLALAAAAALTGAVSDWTGAVEDLHEWLGENLLVVVVAHVAIVGTAPLLRRLAQHSPRQSTARSQLHGEHA